MTLSLVGFGTAVPPDTTTQTESLACARLVSGPEVRDAAWLTALYRRSGVQTRHQVVGRPVVDDVLAGTRVSGSPFLPDGSAEFRGPTTAARLAQYAEAAPPLAIAAARTALGDAGIDAAAVTHLVTVSCTGFIAPGVDVALIQGLGLRPTTQRTHVGFMGCHAAINGLRVAAGLVAANPAAVVLLTAVELCSLHYHFGNDAAQAVANALFADGAAAVVGVDAPPVDRPTWRLAATGSCLIPDSTADMCWRIGDHGFEMGLGKTVADAIARHLRPWLEDWLQANLPAVNDRGLNAIRGWAVHPGGPKIVSVVQESLGLPAEALAASRGVLSEFGNMSSPTVLFVLERLRQAGDLPRPCVMLGFGPGLFAEAALLV
jgi:predicted naringenin-chalcone synthase